MNTRTHAGAFQYAEDPESGPAEPRGPCRTRNTHAFDHFVEVSLGTEHASRPSDDPVPVRNEPRGLGRTSLENIEHMPHVVECELRLAHAHAQAEQRGLALRLRFLRVRSSRVWQSPVPRWHNWYDCPRETGLVGPRVCVKNGRVPLVC